MINKLLVIVCILLNGCEFISPNTSKAITEQKHRNKISKTRTKYGK